MTADDISDPRTFRWVETGVSGLARPREWDVVVAATCEASGERCVFVCLEGTRTLVEEGDAEGAVSCAVEALAGELEPPYRAVAQRRAGETWAVGAVAIEVAVLPAEFEGDELVLTVAESGQRELVVDGRPSEAAAGPLEAVARGASEPYVLRAARLEGLLWEVAIDPL